MHNQLGMSRVLDDRAVKDRLEILHAHTY